MSFVDPLGLDAILVDFQGFPVYVGTFNNIKVYLPLGHDGVVSVNPTTGGTKYFQYGRYDGTCGKVQQEGIPDLQLDKDGNPTAASLKNYMTFYQNVMVKVFLLKELILKMPTMLKSINMPKIR